MDIESLRKLSKEELESRLAEKKIELLDLDYDLKSNKSTDTSKRKELKKEIARISTLINEVNSKEEDSK